MRAMFRILATGLVLATASIQIALAQMPSGPTSKVMLIMMPEVKKEIKLTRDQDKQVQALLKEMSGGQPNMSMGTGGLSSIFAEMDAKTMAILTPEQQARTNQLWIQYDGPVVLEDKAIADALQLTDEQRTKVKHIWTDYSSQFLEKMRAGQSGYKAIKGVRRIANEATIAILTAEQITALKAMGGKEIKFRNKREY
jgi:Spy/CpxP family protein refolding chaperone